MPTATGCRRRTGDAVQEVLGFTSELPVELYHLGPTHAYFALSSPDAVAALDPELRALAKLSSAGIKVESAAPTSGGYGY